MWHSVARHLVTGAVGRLALRRNTLSYYAINLHSALQILHHLSFFFLNEAKHLKFLDILIQYIPNEKIQEI